MNAIKCEGVSKSFKEKKALDHVDFEIETGKIYALLGRNGAGKTTLMNCICTKYLQDEGNIEVLGEQVYENEKVLKQICFMSDNMNSFELKKVKYILKFAENFYENWNKSLESRLLELFELDIKSSYVALSRGQRTAVSIIIGLCSGCEIVLFDEIYSGLDAVARQEFYEILMEEQEKNPRTYILSTHLIEEMSGLFDGVIILDKGRVILCEDVEKIHSKSLKIVGRTNQMERLKNKNVLRIKEAGTIVECILYDDISLSEREMLKESGFDVSSAELQELFVAMTAGNTKCQGEEYA